MVCIICLQHLLSSHSRQPVNNPATLYPSSMSTTQSSSKPQSHTVSQGAMPTNASSKHYAPSTTSSKASFSSSFSSKFGSIAKLPLLSRVKSSHTESSQTSSSGTPPSSHGSTSGSSSTRKPRDPVKTVPSGKPPATTFADLAYRYGTPSVPNSGRL